MTLLHRHACILLQYSQNLFLLTSFRMNGTKHHMQINVCWTLVLFKIWLWIVMSWLWLSQCVKHTTGAKIKTLLLLSFKASISSKIEQTRTDWEQMKVRIKKLKRLAAWLLSWTWHSFAPCNSLNFQFLLLQRFRIISVLLVEFSSLSFFLVLWVWFFKHMLFSIRFNKTIPKWYHGCVASSHSFINLKTSHSRYLSFIMFSIFQVKFYPYTHTVLRYTLNRVYVAIVLY